MREPSCRRQFAKYNVFRNFLNAWNSDSWHIINFSSDLRAVACHKCISFVPVALFVVRCWWVCKPNAACLVIRQKLRDLFMAWADISHVQIVGSYTWTKSWLSLSSLVKNFVSYGYMNCKRCLCVFIGCSWHHLPFGLYWYNIFRILLLGVPSKCSSHFLWKSFYRYVDIYYSHLS
jgi:hypothetical protein